MFAQNSDTASSVSYVLTTEEALHTGSSVQLHSNRKSSFSHVNQLSEAGLDQCPDTPRSARLCLPQEGQAGLLHGPPPGPQLVRAFHQSHTGTVQTQTLIGRAFHQSYMGLPVQLLIGRAARSPTWGAKPMEHQGFNRGWLWGGRLPGPCLLLCFVWESRSWRLFYVCFYVHFLSFSLFSTFSLNGTFLGNLTSHRFISF